jgi:adenosylmethionine-8-amino-7-oxononanoate aminotransferase
LSKVFYSDSGSTAVEIALKIAFQFWQQQKPAYRRKTGFISLAESYHGDTIGSVSVGGIDLFHEIYRPLLFKTRKIPTPHCYRCSFGKTYPDCGLFCAEQAARVIRKHCHETAALIIEPLVQGAAGMLMQPPGYLKKIRQLCTKHNILMIADEVATGFGRTGKMFSCEHEDVSPDILCVAKGITGGYLPLAATLTTNKIYQGFLGEHRDLRTFFHGHTYTGNPLACAAAIANIDLFQTKYRARLSPNRIPGKTTAGGNIRMGEVRRNLQFINGRRSDNLPSKTRPGYGSFWNAEKRGSSSGRWATSSFSCRRSRCRQKI